MQIPCLASASPSSALCVEFSSESVVNRAWVPGDAGCWTAHLGSHSPQTVGLDLNLDLGAWFRMAV